MALASKARYLFESSQPAQKNKILRALLANLKLDEKRLQLNLLQPLSALSADLKSQNWLTTIEEVITVIKKDLSANY